MSRGPEAVRLKALQGPGISVWGCYGLETLDLWNSGLHLTNGSWLRVLRNGGLARASEDLLPRTPKPNKTSLNP